MTVSKEFIFDNYFKNHNIPNGHLKDTEKNKLSLDLFFVFVAAVKDIYLTADDNQILQNKIRKDFQELEIIITDKFRIDALTYLNDEDFCHHFILLTEKIPVWWNVISPRVFVESLTDYVIQNENVKQMYSDYYKTIELLKLSSNISLSPIKI